MTVITIRQVPEELNDRLKERARERGQSVQQFLLGELHRIADESPLEQRLREVLERAPRTTVTTRELRAAWEQRRVERDA